MLSNETSMLASTAGLFVFDINHYYCFLAALSKINACLQLSKCQNYAELSCWDRSFLKGSYYALLQRLDFVLGVY